MTEDNADRRTGPHDDRPRGLHLGIGIRVVSDLLDGLLGATGGGSPRGRSTGARTRRPAADAGRRTRGRTDRRSSDATHGERAVPVDAHLLDTRRAGDEVIVTVDVPGASGDDLTVGVEPDSQDLVVGWDGAVLDRLSLPWESVAADGARFNNGVLEIRVRPADAAR